MPVDYTVVISVRQRFGDSKNDPFETDEEKEAPFVGSMKEFTFDCPNLDRSEFAILQFQSLGVSTRSNLLQVNGANVFGGLSRSTDLATFHGPHQHVPVFTRKWVSHHLLISAGSLQEQNKLCIEAKPIESDTNNLDNFLVDNMVVTFKTRGRPPIGPGLCIDAESG